jgi:UDP:flavonoid glycosyltransferase YjiC (YdhE family)
MKPVYEFRKELGLARGRHPAFEGQHSPQLNLGLFSTVLCQPQPDWPPHSHITGFPFYDKKDGAPVAPELLKFLDEGAAPLVFTLGSAAVHIAGDFFHESIEAAQLLKRRAVLLVGKDTQKPAALPEGIVAFDYAPHSELFPRAACIVHQGGVGTTGQALRAGVPTLIVPFSHDQPDNAARTVRTGTGRTLSRGSYKAERVAKELRELVEDPAYAARAKSISEAVRAEHGAYTAVDLMVKMLDRGALP